MMRCKLSFLPFFVWLGFCGQLDAQQAVQWSFDHIKTGEKPSVAYNNQKLPELEAKASGAVQLQQQQRLPFVLNPAGGEFHQNVSTLYFPPAGQGWLKVDAEALPSDGSFTLESFVRYPASQLNLFFVQTAYEEPRHGFEIGVMPEGRAFARVDALDDSGRSAGQTTLTGPGQKKLNDGKWHHLALVYDDAAQTATLWLDGQAGKPAKLAGRLQRPRRDLVMGKFYGANTELWLDEVRLSPSALPASAFLKAGASGGALANRPSELGVPKYPLRLIGEKPAPGQWGTTPRVDEVLGVSPPSFVWPPQPQISRWDIEVTDAEGKVVYAVENLELTVHRPPQVFAPGAYGWRYRGGDAEGNFTEWSEPRGFKIAEGASAFVLPPREELLARIPKGHPRLFLTPDNLEKWREKNLGGDMSEHYRAILARVDKWLKNAPDTREPEPYKADELPGTSTWHARWTRNFYQTLEAATAAYLIGFVARIEDSPEIAAHGVAILMSMAEWDPAGPTASAKSSEAAYAYLWGLARAYTLLYDYMTPEQRAVVRERLLARGRVMHGDLVRRQHLWKPFDSHLNRTWHFLGELGIALHGEAAEADEWLWYAMNVFANIYPVWGGADGGWHEGGNYHGAYLNRFLWWTVVMEQALGIRAFEVSPFFRKSGEFILYNMPPYMEGAGWGDQSELINANTPWNLRRMEHFARLTGNPTYQDYATRARAALEGEAAPADDLPHLFLMEYASPEAGGLDALPVSKVFADTGQVIFNTSLTDARTAVQVQFKAADFYGSFSHGYEANNSFIVWAYGKRMLIKTGYRDSYGSAHHKGWMWSTRSTNNITVSGMGQFPNSMLSRGHIVDSYLGKGLDLVSGEAGGAYFQKIGERSLLRRYTRALVFIKPSTLVVVDYLSAYEPQSFGYWLHASEKFGIGGQGDLSLDNGGVTMASKIIEPQGLAFSQSNEYDPNPHDHIKLREWHLTASPPQRGDSLRFIAAYTFSPAASAAAQLHYTVREDGDYTVLDILQEQGGFARLRLPLLRGVALSAAAIGVELHSADGEVTETGRLGLGAGAGQPEGVR